MTDVMTVLTQPAAIAGLSLLVLYVVVDKIAAPILKAYLWRNGYGRRKIDRAPPENFSRDDVMAELKAFREEIKVRVDGVSGRVNQLEDKLNNKPRKK